MAKENTMTDAVAPARTREPAAFSPAGGGPLICVEKGMILDGKKRTTISDEQCAKAKTGDPILWGGTGECCPYCGLSRPDLDKWEANGISWRCRGSDCKSYYTTEFPTIILLWKG